MKLIILTLVLSLGATLSAVRGQSAQAKDMKARAQKLHQDAIVVDGHVHITNAVFYQGIDPWQVQKTGCFDYARARQGGLDVVIEHVYIDDEYNTYNYAVKQACRLIETFYRVLDANRDKMELALSSSDIRRIVAAKKMAVVLALEGGFDMEGDLDVLRLFHRLGVRMIQLTNHETTNSMVDTYGGEQKWKGISEQGRKVIAEMNRLGIVVDISHASDAAKAQVIEASRVPVVTSHNGLRHFTSAAGTLRDDTLQALAQKGGMMGLHSAGWMLSQKSLDWGYYVFPKGFSRPAPPPRQKLERSPLGDYGEFMTVLDRQMRDKWLTDDWGGYGYGQPWRERQQAALQRGAPAPTVEDWAEQVGYVITLVGDDHIGIGLDMMSGGNWLRDFDATSYPRITEALVAKGYSDKTIRKVLGENWLRLLDSAKVTK